MLSEDQHIKLLRQEVIPWKTLNVIKSSLKENFFIETSNPIGLKYLL